MGLFGFGRQDIRATGTEGAVCEDIAQRQQHGLNKYGKTVADNPLNIYEWMQHAYEESLDFSVYIKRAMQEMGRSQEFLVTEVDRMVGELVLVTKDEDEKVRGVERGDTVIVMVLKKGDRK